MFYISATFAPCVSLILNFETGEQLSNVITFGYEDPTISSLTTDALTKKRRLNGQISSTTDAMSLNVTSGKMERTIATLTGSNFGTSTNQNVNIIFTTEGEEPNRIFTVPRKDIISINALHTEMKFYLPPGYGLSVNVIVKVDGQPSTTTLPFSYDAPKITSIQMDCSGYDELR